MGLKGHKHTIILHLLILKIIHYILLSSFLINNSIIIASNSFSIMLSTQEESAIERALGQDPVLTKDTCQSDLQPLFLGAILYFKPTQWTLWLNDQTISPDQTDNILKIYKVTPSGVIIHLPTLSKKKFLIKPNQTFMPSLCKVIDGDHRIKIIEEKNSTLKKNQPIIARTNIFYTS